MVGFVNGSVAEQLRHKGHKEAQRVLSSMAAFLIVNTIPELLISFISFKAWIVWNILLILLYAVLYAQVYRSTKTDIE